ncbi:MAG: hypothetical protein ACKOA9_04770, partial [Actinomycetota bacterium]
MRTSLRPRRVVPLLLAGLLAAAGLAVPARAQTSTADKQAQLKNQILEVGSQEAAALQLLQEIRNRKAPIDARVAELDAQLRDVQERLAPFESQIAVLDAQLADAQARLDARQAEYEVARAEVLHSAAQIYKSARHGASYDSVTAARPEDVVQGSKYLDQVNGRQRAVVRRATALRDDVQSEQRTISSKRADLETASAAIVALRNEVAALRAEIEPARAQAAAEAAAEEAQLKA